MSTTVRRLLILAALPGLVPSAELSAQATPDALVPDSVLVAPGFPRIVRLPAPSPGIVSLRLSIPLDERPAEAGAGQLLQELATRRATGPASNLGARLESGRTPWGIVYTVTGPVADLDYLAYVLREATRAPTSDPARLDPLRNELDERLRRLEETGAGRIEASLREQASPEPPLEGTRGTLPTLGGGRLHELWARTHRPERMTLLVSGDVADPVLLATMSGLGAGPDVTPPPPLETPAPAPPRPATLQTLRRWHGVAWSVAGVLDARAAVAAALLGDRLRADRNDYEAQVRLWEAPSRTVIVAIGAAYGNDATVLSRRLAELPRATAENLRPGEVAGVARRLREDLVLQARTPWGRVHLVGRFLDAGQDGLAATRYLESLETMGDAEIRSFLLELAEGTSYTATARR